VYVFFRKHIRPSGAAEAVRKACLHWQVIFAVFFYCYFYYVQAPALTLAQHRLSEGVTSYSPVVGAMVLTFLMMGLQRLVGRVLVFSRGYYLLTYYPSALCAVLLTAFVPVKNTGAVALSVVTAVIWLLTVGVLEMSADGTMGGTRGDSGRGGERRPYIKQLITFFLLTLYMGGGSGSDDVTTYEVHMARLLDAGYMEEALEVGQGSLATSPRLTAYRAYALSQTRGAMGEELFRYPLSPEGSEALLPREADSLKVLLPPQRFYAYLKSPRPASQLPAAEYFRKVAEKDPQGVAADYRLCALLLDRELKQFAEELPTYYPVADSVILPRYYAEALILYQRLDPASHLLYTDPNIIANYIDFKEKGETIARPQERRTRLWREYGDTYWWYYFYGPGGRNR
jgi:hypothetical protein